MKTLICYFSGTGNTKKVIDKYTDIFEEKGFEVDTFKVENEKFDFNLEEYEHIGFAYPIHAFNAPSIMIEFIKKLPVLSKKKDIFIIKTSGEPLKMNNISSLKMKKMLKKRNMILTNEYHYCMPYNIIFRHSDAMVYKMWDYARQMIPIDCERIILKKPDKLSYVFMGSFFAWLFRIEYWGSRFNGKKYKVNEKCLHCRKCINSCPTHNITEENGEIKFGKNCIMCMRCSFFCPVNAIKIGWFEKWKVNGKYNFEKTENIEDDKHKNFCKKAYRKYFKKCDEKIKNYNDTLNTQKNK